jgi:hypothetical protein
MLFLLASLFLKWKKLPPLPLQVDVTNGLLNTGSQENIEESPSILLSIKLWAY